MGRGPAPEGVSTVPSPPSCLVRRASVMQTQAGACRSLGPRGPHADGGWGAPWCPGHWSLDTFLAESLSDCAGAAADETLTPGPTARLSEPLGKGQEEHTDSREGGSHAAGGARRQRDSSGTGLHRKPLLPLPPSSDCPAAPSPWGSSPRGVWTLAPQGSHCPRAFAWLLRSGAP